MLMAYSYDVDANDMNGASRLHLLDAFSGEGHSSGVAIGYGGDVFDLLTVGNAGAPDGGVQMGFSIHGWIDEVRLYDTALNLAEIQDVRIEMIPATACIQYPLGDANRDCKVDMNDLVVIAGEWMDCKFYPAGFCWD